MSRAEISPFSIGNVKRFIAFRVCFNARFYYPVFTILFLDFGLTLEQFAILNTAWALSIVLLEVPSGALADTVGRRNLVAFSALLMVIEMLLILFAPIGNSSVVFYLFLLNRILSGAAEAAASGADEALAYDSLKEQNLEDKWGMVLERQMKVQSIGFVLAMSLGAVLYDAEMLGTILSFLGIDAQVDKSLAMRLPVLCTLALGLICIFITLSMREVGAEERASANWRAIALSFRKTLRAGAWILATPPALTVICAGMLFDHVVRLVLTLNSEFYRLIQIPEYSFGFIAAALGVFGAFLPRLGRYLAENKGKTFNFIALCASIAAGLWLMGRFTPYYSALPMLLVYAGVFLTGYFVSHYLNEITESSQRATVLSFKGLSFNLAYGLIGYVYAVAISQLRNSERMQSLTDEQLQGALFKEVFAWSPYYFAIAAAAVFTFSAWQQKAGKKKASASSY